MYNLYTILNYYQFQYDYCQDNLNHHKEQYALMIYINLKLVHQLLVHFYHLLKFLHLYFNNIC